MTLRWLSAAAVVGTIALACSGADVAPDDPDGARLLAKSSLSVVAMTSDASTLYWIDEQSGIFSLPKTGGTPVPLGTAPALPRDYTGTVFRPSLVIADSALMFAVEETIYRCSIARGCLDGAEPFVKSASPVLGLSTDGNLLAWTTVNGTRACVAADCRPRSTKPGCVEHADCPATQPLCVSGDCVVCTSADRGACPSGTVCSGNLLSCVECAKDADCSGSRPFCHKPTGKCVECDEAHSCASGLVCADDGSCKTCDADLGKPGAACGPQANASVCVSGVCSACAANCASPSSCIPYAGGETCLAPCTDSSQCEAGQLCAEQPFTSLRFCYPQSANGKRCSRGIECSSGICSSLSCGQSSGYPCTATSQCTKGVCAKDGLCGGLDGDPCSESTDCRAMQCKAGICRDETLVRKTNTLVALGAGSVYVSQSIGRNIGSSRIYACPNADCSAFRVLKTQEKLDDLTLLGASSTMLYYEFSNGRSVELHRCALPDCTSDIAIGEPLGISGVREIGDYLYFPGGPEVHRCPKDQCLRANDEDLFAREIRASGLTSVQLGVVPWTADDQFVYLVTQTDFGNSGHRVLAVPVPPRHR